MARKRVPPTIEILIEALARLGVSPKSVDLEALRTHLELPEFGGFVQDARVARALLGMKANRIFAETGIEALKKALPGLRAVVSKDDSITWSVRVSIPLLDDGRLYLRIDVEPNAAATNCAARTTVGSSSSPTPSVGMVVTRGFRTCRMMPFG